MEKYELVKDIGAEYIQLGGLMGVKNSKELVAMKYIERGSKINDDLVREIMKHKSLDHPNVIRFKEVVLTPTHLAIVMEYAARGELYKHIRRAGKFCEDDARYLFQQLISGVSYCHAMQMCHRELKLEETFLDGSPKPCLKICDFRYSKSAVRLPGPNSKTRSAAYVPPEVFSCSEYDGKMADIWSCGVTLYVMLVGARPFEDQDDHVNLRKTIQKVKNVQYKIPDEVHMSEDCRHLLSLIFVANPVERISIAEIKKHPWFLKNLPRELTETAQAAYFKKEKQNFSLQTVEEIMKIVDDAKTPPPVSLYMGGFGWGGEGNAERQEEDEEEEDEEEEDEDYGDGEITKKRKYTQLEK